ncbi:N-acetylneuraminate lyase-like [Cydia pomonella]|uniref:N-acetylneuraminate lyase-like n=1 Tax=Cydia pomonella TaxID=82600 RepID=UPI002ADE1703|nr:N-acetylneuraminate lyase-like [Cydia pomonella]
MVFFDIKGVIAPVFTPIDDAGCINFSVIPEYFNYLHENGVHGILVGGTTGESITLNLEERRALLEAWVKARPEGMKIIMQVGGVPMPDVIKMAQYAEQLKADAIMTLPEIYYKPKTVEHLVDYLHAVSSAAPSLPLLYYHFPMMSGVDVNMPEFFKLASARIPNFKGMKADLGVALQVSDQLGEDQRIFNGNHLVAPPVLLGHDSSIATVTNMFPRLVRGVIDAVKGGEVVKARALQEKLNNLVTAISSQGEFLPTMKAAMPMITGIQVGPPRRPLASIDDQKKNQLMENLSRMNFGRMDDA